ncbi:MAG: primosomal protein N', partial [Candidatus Neomarinimicrobiota bacterium]|nr:primosomal protein N' [Candidatus Neomarinimicrobiota bacterium]
MYVQVSFPISSFNSFTYSVPKGLIKKISLGVCINAPIKNKLQSGFIIDINKKPLFSGKILPIHSIHDKSYHLPNELWETIKWLSKYYVVPIGKVLKAAIPNTILNQYSPQTIKYALITKKGEKKFLENDHKKPAHQKVLSYLFNNKLIKIKKLKDIVSSPYSICKKLEENGFIKIFLQPKITNPYNNINPNKIKNIVLSKEQKKIFNEIIKFKKEKKPFLIHGVTGSGKTEIYMKLAQTIIKQGNSVLVLVPEIALTPQITQRFYSAFGNKIALWHSQMTKAEKGWSWKKINSGEYPIIIGARSAIFAPIKNLGLIIVDEEQESSFKQENPNPRYNARDVAIVRAKYSHSIILLASATPSLESYYNSLQKKYILLKLSKRYGESVYPKIELVDMKKQNEKSSIISKQLINAIDDCLNKSEQIILLQNRRGYSSIQQCNNCGKISTCKNCAVAMTYHKTDNYMHCHYCEKINKINILCSHCNNDAMEFKGTGTQKVEKIIGNIFPNIKILRMDVDTVRK